MSTERIPFIAPDHANDELRRVYEEIGATRGGHVGNVFRALGSSPETLRVLAGVGAHFRERSTLRPAERELLVLAIAAERRCAYEWTHHLRAADRIGLAREQVTAELEGSSDPRIDTIVEVAKVIAAGRPVEAGQVARLREAVGDATAVETVVMAAYYVALARILDAFDVPLEHGVEPEALPPGD